MGTIQTNLDICTLLSCYQIGLLALGQVTAEDNVNAEKLFGTLAHITTSQLPQSRLLTMLGDSRSVFLKYSFQFGCI